MTQFLVLSIGVDVPLLNARNFVLQSAGYSVVPARSLKEAVDHFRSGDFDLVLLCHSIPAKEKEHLTCWIRASGSRIPVVSVSGIFGQEDAFANATVVSDPKALLLGIREALVKAANPASATARSLNGEQVAAGQRKRPPRPSAGAEEQPRTKEDCPTPAVRAG